MKEHSLAHLDGLSKEAFPKDFSVNEVTGTENTMRAAGRRAEGFGAPNIPGQHQGFFRRRRNWRLTDAIATSTTQVLILFKCIVKLIALPTTYFLVQH